jgi:acetyl esterase/lipase
VLGGSEGGLLGEGVAATLARRGYAALALAYFGTRSLPSELVEIPVEYFAEALRWRRLRPDEADGDRVALMGGSKGGELALLLGATYPEDIRAVVGYVPSGVVYQGVSFDPWYYVRGVRSSWTSRGKSVPFVDASPGPFDSVR